MALRTVSVQTSDSFAHGSLGSTEPYSLPLLSRGRLVQVLGALWLLDGALQLQPSMFTSHLTTDIMAPVLQGQPGLVGATIQPLLHLTTQHLLVMNGLIALVQLVLGACLLSGRWIRPALLLSIPWALAVWYGGEGLGMLLTGQASVLTGAPGPVLLYGFLALVAYPRTIILSSLFTRLSLRSVLAGFWVLAAALQLQPTWWQAGQISRAVAANQAPGTVNGAILDPFLGWLSAALSGWEVQTNSAVIVIALSLAVGLVVVSPRRAHLVLGASIAVSVVMWCATQGCGLLLTGGSTDVNLGPLLILFALVAWRTNGRDIDEGRSRQAGVSPLVTC